MADTRRMTADRFFGGVHGRLTNLQAMLSHISAASPTEENLITWVINNTKATSEDAVRHHLQFIHAIGLIDKQENRYQIGEYGAEYQIENDENVLYEALTSGVKGFQTILRALTERPLTDEDIMELLVSTYDECEMTTPGPAARHREWLQAIGYLERDGTLNRITKQGRSALSGMTPRDRVKELSRQLRQSDMRCVRRGPIADRQCLPLRSSRLSSPL